MSVQVWYVVHGRSLTVRGGIGGGFKFWLDEITPPLPTDNPIRVVIMHHLTNNRPDQGILRPFRAAKH